MWKTGWTARPTWQSCAGPLDKQKAGPGVNSVFSKQERNGNGRPCKPPMTMLLFAGAAWTEPEPRRCCCQLFRSSSLAGAARAEKGLRGTAGRSAALVLSGRAAPPPARAGRKTAARLRAANGNRAGKLCVAAQLPGPVFYPSTERIFAIAPCPARPPASRSGPRRSPAAAPGRARLRPPPPRGYRGSPRCRRRWWRRCRWSPPS